MIVRNTSALVILGESDAATAARVTEAIGLVPTSATEAGVPPARGRPKPYSRWLLDVESDPEDESGFGSMRILLSVVLPAADALRSLRRDYEIRVVWGGFSDSSQGGFLLEPDVLQGLAQLALPVYGTAYVD